MVRCMINEKNIPKTFWPEAVNWAVHILNRCPTFAVKDITPEEAWSGIKPSVSHFRIFGCIAYAHVPDNLRKKLDDKSVVCVHLGLSEESKAYKLYDPIRRRIIVSKDVMFDEFKQWNWESKTAEKTNLIVDCDEIETSAVSAGNETINE
ncbi:equilibrative nucleoside transporter 3-like protein, partial [Trifolium pratense]